MQTQQKAQDKLCKTVLITGASSGIGAALAYEFAKLAYNVILSGRNVDALHSMRDELQQHHAINVAVIRLDLTTPDAAKQLSPSIDVLINNGGAMLNRLIKLFDVDQE